MLPRRTAMLLCLAVGVALEVWISATTHRREAWDTGVYWSVGLPFAICVAAAVGYLTRDRGWLAAMLIVPGQVLAMLYRGGSAGNLWPLTLALSFVLGLPFALVAYVAGRFRHRNA